MSTSPSHEPRRCPNDASLLVEVERAGVLIDACPQCRGVWLDRGELDKILERDRRPAETAVDDDAFLREVGGQRSSAPRDESPRYSSEDDDYRGGHKRRRRRSLLEELFDD